MSCCTTEKPIKTSKNFEELKRYFDNVDLVQYESYQHLTLRDKAPGNLDYINFLEVKISRFPQNSNCNYSDIKMLDSVSIMILDWVDILKEPMNERIKEVSLFGDDFEVEKKPPQMPNSDGNWAKYFNDSGKFYKEKLKNMYTFLELFNPYFYHYTGIDHRIKLPSQMEYESILKDNIIYCNDNKNSSDTIEWIKRDKKLSDIELTNRIKAFRVHLVPYLDYFRANYDNSYNNHSSKSKETNVRYRYYFDRGKITHSWCHDFDKKDVSDIEKQYNEVYDNKFILWLREILNIENIDCISDDDILKDSVEAFMDSFTRSDRMGIKDYDWKSNIKKFKNSKQFHSNVINYLKSNNIDYKNGSSSGGIVDGFSVNIDKFGKKATLTITQDINFRMQMCREIIEVNRFGNAVIYDLEENEVFEKAFEFFSNKDVKQLNIFDFLAA